MSRVTVPHEIPSRITWTTPPEPGVPVPGLLASAEAIACYLDESRHNLGEHLDHDTVSRFCKKHGASQHLDQVVDLLEELDAKCYRDRVGPVLHNKWEWAAVQDRVPSYVYRCPRLLWNMTRRGGRVFPFRDFCHSWLCPPRCAPSRVEDDLLWGCRRLKKHDRIWLTVVPHSTSMLAQVRQRRRRAGAGGCAWIHRFDRAAVYIFATRDLAKPDSEPTYGVWLDTDEALRVFSLLLLRLPGVARVSWVGTWRKPTKPRRPPTSFHIGEAPKEVMEAAIAEAEQALDDQYGPGALDRFSEQEIELRWLPLVKAALDHQWQVLKEQRDR